MTARAILLGEPRCPQCMAPLAENLGSRYRVCPICKRAFEALTLEERLQAIERRLEPRELAHVVGREIGRRVSMLRRSR